MVCSCIRSSYSSVKVNVVLANRKGQIFQKSASYGRPHTSYLWQRFRLALHWLTVTDSYRHKQSTRNGLASIYICIVHSTSSSLQDLVNRVGQVFCEEDWQILPVTEVQMHVQILAHLRHIQTRRGTPKSMFQHDNIVTVRVHERLPSCRRGLKGIT